MESKIFASRYELLERIGMGGMAVVYKAKDNLLNRNVAVKILRDEFKENEDFIRRFKSESQAAACLSHQNIVQIYDVGEEDGMHYIVMELLEGITLKQHMNAKGGRLSPREALNFSMQICRALEHAHLKYVVHRDIKPQNIVITESGKLKVADFGIARAANNTTTVNSKNDVVVGSAHYLSPEQARGGYTDLRSDIYSLGIVMYEMFTGKLPFDGEESVSVVMQHLNDEPVAPREVNPDLSYGIEAIILKAMKKEQRLRYSNATEILEDLVLVYQNPSISTSQLNASSAATASPSSGKQSHSSASRSASRKKRKKKKAYLPPLFIALSVLIMVTAAFFLILKPLLFPDMGEDVNIPDLTGMTLTEAQAEAERASTEDVEFTVVEGHYEYSESEKDTIIDQTPSPGGSVKRSREITVVISKGNIALELEDYTGMEYEDVKTELEKLGVKVEKKEASNDEYDSGIIFNQNPREGTQMAIGDVVTLYVSEGVKSTVVPNLINLTREEALSTAEGSKLVVTVKEEPSSKYDIGKVSYQSIDAFESVPVGTEIIIHISTGKKDSDNEEKKDNKEEDEETTPKDKKDNSTTAPPVPQKKSVSVTLSNLPKDRETVSVRLVHDGQTYYEKDFSTAQGSATISIETDKDLSLDVYYDGTYITTKEVKY